MLFRVNAFTDDIKGGNPAGVHLNSDKLTDTEMLAIAKEVNYSETAFVMASDKADFKIRYFTPSDEVDLCGHATIATFTVLFKESIVSQGNYTIDTLAGILPVEVKSDGTVLMNQLKPSFYEVLDKSTIAESLGVRVDDILLEPQITSTGLKDIMVYVSDSKVLRNLKPNFPMITAISKKYDSTGYHVFTLDSEFTARCRNFAPLYAINEESATGTASGAVSGYIIKNNLVETTDGINHFIFEQGIEMEKPSSIHAYINIKNDEIESVVIGGRGLIIKK